MGAKTLAAIDIGTNSFHLVVVRADDATGRFTVLDREKEIVRLGSGSREMKRLSVPASRRGLAALRHFTLIAARHGAAVRAVATSAVREADNRDAFLLAVRKECKLDVDLISGAEEARLIYLGVLQALPVYDRRILLVDIGGGSTEFLIGRRREVKYDQSLKIGAVRLTQMFFPEGLAGRKRVRECREHVRGLLQPIRRAIDQAGFESVVATSGTAVALAHLVRLRRGESVPVSMNHFECTKEELLAAIEEVVALDTPAERERSLGIDGRRADIIVAGAIIAEQCIRELGIRRWTISEYALREGVILDTIEKESTAPGHRRLNRLRRDSIERLAVHAGDERQHSQHVARLAMQLFDGTSTLHDLGEREREFLEAAALLHEIGLFISHDQHHLHSHYLIRNAELLGYTEREKQLIANVARYHRKSHPKEKHEDFRALNGYDKEVVRVLAGILRVADGLDRTHRSVVRAVACRRRGRTVRVVLGVRRGASAELERWGAERKKALLEEALGITMRFSSPG